jgi:hypothetical protein
VKITRPWGQNEYQYVFSAHPQFGTSPGDDIFEKARQIVACIRHGQHHAEGTRIMYPSKILAAMQGSNMKPHPYFAVQYYTLVTSGIVTLTPVDTSVGTMYQLEWIDTPENNSSAIIASQLLSGQEPYAETNEELEARKILLQGSFHYTAEQRRLKSSIQIIARKPFERIVVYTSGVKL